MIRHKLIINISYVSLGIINYMNAQSGDSSLLLDTLKKIKTYLDYHADIGVVGFFNNEDDELYRTFQDNGR